MARGQVTSYGHGRFPCRRRALWSPPVRRAAAVSRSGQFCSITVALGVGSGEARFPPRHLVSPRLPAASPRLPCCCAASRPPPPAPDALSAPRQVLGNFHGGPGLLSCLWHLLLTDQDPHSLPAPPREEKNSLSSVNSPQPSAAPRTKQTNARGLVEIRSPPPSPICKISSRDRFRSAMVRWSTRPSLPPLFSGDRDKQK